MQREPRMAILTGSFYVDALAIITSLLAVLVVFYKWCFTYWNRQGVYSLPPSIPFGNATKMVLQKNCMGVEFKNFYEQIRSKKKPYGGFYFFAKPIFVPADLDLVKQIMTTDFEHFTDHVLHVDEETDPLSAHLFSLKGTKWRKLRVKLTPTFTSGKMKMMFGILEDCSSELVDVMNKYVEEKEPLDIKDIVGRFTTDIIGCCAFGIECNSLKNPDSEFRKYGKIFFETSFRDSVIRLLSITVPEVFTYFRISSLRKDMCDFFMNIVNQTVNYREQNKIIRKDFMHLLLQLKNKVKITENDIGDLQADGTNDQTEDSTLTITEIAAQCFVFFLAGFETSSTTSTFCLYELARNLEIQQKLRDEINRVLEKHNGKITYDAMMEMTYMDQCINETLRKYPPVPVHTRECTKTYKVPNSDVVLKKGSFVFIPVLGIQLDPEYYPDPERFDPERFSEENKAKRHASAFTPFGDGPRTCIGLRFGIMQTKIGLMVLLKNFKFTLHCKTEEPLTMDPGGFVLGALKGIWLNAEKIK